MTDADRHGRRRWLRIVLVCPLLALVGLGLWFGLHATRIHGQTRRRAAWLDRAESEIERTIRRGTADPTRSGAAPWLGPDSAVFDRGGAGWRVHTFHHDPGEGADWSGIGNIAVLIDDRGRKYYSRSHFCDGTLPWALSLGVLDAPPPRPADCGAFLGLFRPGTWTADRPVVEAAIPPR